MSGARRNRLAGLGRFARQHFIQHGAERVSVSGKRTCHTQSRRAVGKISDLDLAFRAEKHMDRPQIAMRDSRPMSGDQGFGDGDSDVYGDSQGKGRDAADALLKRDAAYVFAHDIKVLPVFGSALVIDAEDTDVV